MQPAAALVPTMILVVVGGCVGSEPPAAWTSEPAVAPPADVSPETGSIEGRVLDEELAPIPEAEAFVEELGANASMRTDAEGRFTYNGVPPGSYSVIVRRLGYESLGRKVHVEAGKIASVQFVLRAVPVVDAYHETFPFEGFIGLGAAGPVVTARDLAPGDQTEFRVNVSAPADLQTIVEALRWQSGAPFTARRLLVYTYLDDASPAHNHRGGPSPLVVRLDDARPKQAIQGYVFVDFTKLTGDDPTAWVVVAFQQRFSMLVTLFFGLPAPENYSGWPPEP